MRWIRASAGGSRGVVVPSPASEVGGSARGTQGVGDREDWPCWKGRTNFFISWQSFFLQLDGAT